MKKFISIIVIVVLMAFGSQVYADGNTISMDLAQEYLINNSSILKKLQYQTYKAYDQYENAIKSADEVNIEGVGRLYASRGKILDKYTEMLLIMQRDYTPKEAKYYWEIAQSSEITTKNSLILNLRDMYISLLSSGWNQKILEQELELAKKKDSQVNKEYNLGLISKLDLEESAYNLIKANNDLRNAKRDKENTCRSFNKFIGLNNINIVYDTVQYTEASSKLKDIDYYMENALNRRAEIANAQKEIDLRIIQKDIYEKDNVGNNFTLARKDYLMLLNNVENLKVKLQKMKLDVESEIKSSFIDIKKEQNNISGIKRTIDSQKRNLDKMKSLKKQGMITEIAVEEAEIKINELENNYKLAIYTYNTKVMRLMNSAGVE